MRSQLAIPALLAMLVLAGCGGGGGGGSSAAPAPLAPSPLQGAYTVNTAAGPSLDMIVLEDGTFWALHGIVSNNVLLVDGFARGSSSAANGSFTASVVNFNVPGNVPNNESWSGNYTSVGAAVSAISATLNNNGTLTAMNLTPPAATNYLYSAPATMAAVTGVWNGMLLDGESASVTVGSNGTFSGSSSGGCHFSGSFMPRASGKNVFDIALSFAPSGCTLNGQTVKGIGIDTRLDSGQQQLFIGLVDDRSTVGVAFLAAR